MTASRVIAMAWVAVLAGGSPAWGTRVVVRFQQATDCAVVSRWELLAASIDADRPDPALWDAEVAAIIRRSAAAGACGSNQRATVAVTGRDGPTRFWLRVVASTGVAVSDSIDADLSPRRPGVPTGISTTIVGGGGRAATDCLLAFVAPVNHPATKPRAVRCRDGDPRCDADGLPNGECSIPVAVCANSTFAPGVCASPGVASIAVRGVVDRKGWIDPAAAWLEARIDMDIRPPSSRADACTTPIMARLPVIRSTRRAACRPLRRRLRLVSYSMTGAGGRWRDRDELRMECRPSPEGCSPVR